GHSLRLLVRPRPLAAPPFPAGEGGAIELLEGDLLAPAMESKLTGMMQGCEAVIHIATSIPHHVTGPNAWTANTQLRIRGTGRLQRAALDSGVTTFLQQSIISAYRDGGDDWLDENTHLDQSPERRDICHPVAIMEAMMRLYGRQSKPMRWTILKGGTFVGPGTAQCDLIERIRRHELTIPVDGSHFVSLVHVEDVADAYVLALDRAPSGSIFNICAEPLRYGEYVDGLADLFAAPHPARDPSRPRPPSHRAETKAARDVLGWEPKHSIYPAQ
ncbi:MAG TPA: NAD(P)-dependent oxidoreductase, partial [Terriglobales bacterium]